MPFSFSVLCAYLVIGTALDCFSRAVRQTNATVVRQFIFAEFLTILKHVDIFEIFGAVRRSFKVSTDTDGKERHLMCLSGHGPLAENEIGLTRFFVI